MTTSNNATHEVILGAVASIDHTNRKAVVVDEQGTSIPLIWTASGYIGEKMAKLKEGYYREFTCEKGDYLVIVAIKYLDSPQWVKDRFKGKSGSGRGGSFQPRNERPVIFESIFKSCCDAFPDDASVKYEDKINRIWAVAKPISLDIIKESGA